MKELKLFSLAWPIFIETALFMLLGLVDVLVLSRFDDLAAASVNTANQAVSIITIVFTVISGASAVLISQNLGAKKRENASRIAALSISFNLALGLAVGIIILLFSRNILSFIGAKGKVLDFASLYLSVVGGFLFLQSTMNAMSVIVRNHGMTKISMLVTVGMNLLNTSLDIILVLGLFGFPRLGVLGVAIATVISKAIGVIVLGIFLFKKIEHPSIFMLLKPIPLDDIRDMFRIGVPSALETFLYNLSQLVITSIVLNFLTQTELITKTYVNNITMFFYLFSVAIGQASQIITGHLVGAERMDEAYTKGLRAYHCALAISMSVCLIGVLFRSVLLGLFTDDRAVIELGSNIMLINIAIEFGRTTNLVLIASLRGAGDVYFPTGCAIFSMWAISVAGSYLLAVVFGMGIYGLWVAIAVDECLRGLMMIWRWRSGKWKTKRVIKEA